MTRRSDVFRVSVVPPKPGEGEDWYWRIRPPHGKKGETRRSSKTTDRARAEEGARRVAEQLNRGILRSGTDPTVREVLERFIEAQTIAKAPRGTLKSLRTALKTIGALLGDVRSSKLTAAALILARDALRRRLAASTCNLHVGVVRRAWTWAGLRELVASPFPRVPDLDEEPTKKRPFYPEEVGPILHQLEVYNGGKWLPLFRALSESGHRVGAILEACGRDLHGGPKPWIDVVDQKSGEQRRALILPETVALIGTRAPHERLFPGGGKEGRIAVATVNWVLHRALELAGLDHLEGLVDVHSFRRFVVDQVCQDGESIARGMRITGHANPDIFLRYQRNSRDQPHDAVERIRDRVVASTPSSTPGEASDEAATHDPATCTACGRGSPTDPRTVAAQAGPVSAYADLLATPPRVPPREVAAQAQAVVLKLGRSKLAKTLARMLLTLPEDEQRALVAVAVSPGAARGVKDVALERGWLTREQAKNLRRSYTRRSRAREQA